MPFYTEDEYNELKEVLDNIIYDIQDFFDESLLDHYWAEPCNADQLVKEVLAKLRKV